jgi:hypothetical protein
MKSFASKCGWLCFMLFLSYWHPVSAKDVSIDQKIKTDYLYSFTKAVDWSEAFQTSFNICFLGSNPFRKRIDSDCFINRSGKIKQPINGVKVNQSGFKMSSKLLEVAKLIGERHE